MSNTLELAIMYMRRGWDLVQLHQESKRPMMKDWVNKKFSEKQVKEGHNLGIKLGEHSKWVVDIDLDHPLAVQMADEFLPPTRAVFGRKSSRSSHRLYRITSPAQTKKFKTPAGAMIVEFRSTGCQTVLPGSVHPSGEPVEWESDEEPAEVDPEELLAGLAALQEAVILKIGEPVKRPAPRTNGNRPRPQGGGSSEYGLQALEAECAQVADMPEGGRNDALNRAAFKLGQLVAGGELSEVMVINRLTDAGAEAGLKDVEIIKTVRSGYNKGMAKPRSSDNSPGIPDDSDVDLSGLFSSAKIKFVTKVRNELTPWPAWLLAPPGKVGELCDVMNSTAVKDQPVLSLAACLAFYGAVFGRKVKTETDLRSNLYCLGIAPSGCGKEHARKVLKEFELDLGAKPEILQAEDIASDMALYNQMAATPSCLMLLDEVGHFFNFSNNRNAQSHQRAIPVMMTKMYTSSNSVYKGKIYADRKLNKRADIRQPNLCLYGTSVLETLIEGLNPGEITNGFLGRNLLFMSLGRPRPDFSVKDVDIPQAIVEHAYGWWYHQAETGAEFAGLRRGNAMKIFKDKEALTLFTEFSEYAEVKGSEVGGGHGKDAIWARAWENASKVALIIACGCHTPKGKLVVTGEVAKYAIGIVKKCIEDLCFLIDSHLAENYHERDVKKVLNIIRDHSTGIPRSKLIRKCRWLDSRSLTDVIKRLTQSEEIVESNGSKNARGFSSKVYVPQ